MTLRVLLDSGIFIHSEFVVDAIKPTTIRWGNSETVSHVHGLARKEPHKDTAYQAQLDSLFTVGRLIRERRIDANEYSEINWERMRGSAGHPAFNALRGCQSLIHRCCPAIERTKFRSTIDIRDHLAKGGKKDREAGIELGTANQLAFFEWLCTLKPDHVALLTTHQEMIHLTDFEVSSLREIEWFQFLCERSGSPENYPDVFHLWTAERNGLDAILTLDNTLCKLVSRVRKEKIRKIEIKTGVLRPLDLLRKLGIDQPDPVPVEYDRFYHLHEVE